jgi:hypothetical protein
MTSREIPRPPPDKEQPRDRLTTGAGQCDEYAAGESVTQHPKPRRPQFCPDCGVPNDATGLVHDETCPIALAADVTSAADRDWFAAHPDADHYFRDVTWDEGALLRLAGEFPDVPGDVIGRVQVVRVGPGVRLRRYDSVFLVVDPQGAR